MDTINDQFKYEAKQLADMYHQRKLLVMEITTKEARLKELGLLLEFTDGLENEYNDAEYDVDISG